MNPWSTAFASIGGLAASVFFFDDEDDYSALKVDSLTFFDGVLSPIPDDTSNKKSITNGMTDGDHNPSSASSNDGSTDARRSVSGCCCCNHKGGAWCLCESLTALPPLLPSACGAAGPSPSTPEAAAVTESSPSFRPLTLAPLKLESFAQTPLFKPTTTSTTSTTTGTTATTTCCRC